MTGTISSIFVSGARSMPRRAPAATAAACSDTRGSCHSTIVGLPFGSGAKTFAAFCPSPPVANWPV
jgi:hypothetical protein